MRLALAAAALATACAAPGSVVDPAGVRASRIAELTWILTAVAAGVFALVGALLVVAVVRAARRSGAVRPSDTWIIVAGGIVLPALLLPLVWVRTLVDMRDLSQPPEPPAITIEVLGTQWAYEVTYPGHGVTLTNELRMPADRVVMLRVRSEDVIHSFWIPRLMDKVDMIPGRTNEKWVSGRPGRYRALCSEFCGTFHARHQMDITVLPSGEFDAWLASARR